MPTPERGPGFIRTHLDIRIPLTGFLDTIAAVTLLASHVPGFIATLEKATFLPDVTGAGAGATQTIEVRKGGAAGTILASFAVTLANHVLGGAGISGSVSNANDGIARLSDTDGLSITKAGAGTVFTAGGGTLRLQFRQRPQARI